MKQVTSADGTRIAFDTMGDGPPLLVAVGAFCDRNSGESVARALSERFTVFRWDRRGRGDSGDSPQTGAASVDREAEDLAAVAAEAGGAPAAYGHSSGGSLVLEAAARGAALARIAVYEPPYTDHAASPEFADGLDALCREGERGEAVERFLRLTGAPQPVIDGIKASPGWSGMTALAHTLSRDLALGGPTTVPGERFSQIGVPVLALAGGAGAPWAPTAAHAIADAVPDGEARILDGQNHNPSDEALVPVLRDFLAA